MVERTYTEAELRLRIRQRAAAIGEAVSGRLFDAGFYDSIEVEIVTLADGTVDVDWDTVSETFSLRCFSLLQELMSSLMVELFPEDGPS